MKIRIVKKRVWLFAIGVVLFATLLVGFANNDFKIAKNFDIYYTLFQELNLNYVDEIDPEKLIRTSIDEMLASLDPYTVFIPESEREDFNFMVTGEYGGIGALIRSSGDYVIISEPYQGFPADVAGLRAGDVILEIDGKSAKNSDTRKVSEQLKGAPNTTLELLIKRPGEEKELKMSIVRKKIKISDVLYYSMITDDIGYINLSGFTEGASVEFKEAFLELKKNLKLKSLVFDLRGNPGGSLQEAVQITNFFIEKGEKIVSTKGKIKDLNMDYKAENNPIDTEIPIVVLVNRGTASASEIVSGALQDLDRAVIIGQRTFGKGLVQKARPLSYNTTLKVTTAKYYIPSGRCIQALDYSHRNEDGSVGKVPDSLITEYSTKHGRKVYDGGGIIPDINMEPEKISKLGISLLIKNYIFDYATIYRTKHDSIPSVENFEFTSQDYAGFVEYLKGKDFDYQTESEEKLKELIDLAKQEKYYEKSGSEFAALQEKLAHDKYKDLETFKDEISEFVREEIIVRYYYQKGRIKAIIEDDPEVGKAISILQDKVKYSSILNVK